jgi:hypothetical protein
MPNHLHIGIYNLSNPDRALILGWQIDLIGGQHYRSLADEIEPAVDVEQISEMMAANC